MFGDLAPLYSYMRRYRWQYVQGTLACVATNIVAVQFPRILGMAINRIQQGTTRELILIFALILVGISLVKGVFLYAQRWILIGISREIEFDLRNDLFRNLETQDSGFYQRYRTGDIMARMTNDLNAVRMLLGAALRYSSKTIFLSVFALFFMLRISPYLTLVALAPMPLASILVQYLGRRIHERFERIQASFSDISAQAQENYSGVRLIRAFAREESQIGLFERLNRQYIGRALRLVQLMGMLWPTLEFILGISMVITLLAGGHQVLAHRINVGQFVAFSTYMIMLIWPIIAVGWVINIFQRGTASVKRIDEILKAKPLITDARSTLSGFGEETVLNGEIEFRHLNFSYGDTPVLRDINLKIPAGSSLAIVGPTGSGKSTLAILIARLWEAPEGSLIVDGRPIRQWPIATLRGAIGFVPQDPFLFSETLEENIALGEDAVVPERVSAAAVIASIDAEIRDFPQKYETMVRERGITLSCGQKQRTTLARAVLRDPKILILDDALSSVDTDTEEKILRGLKDVTRNRTTIL